MRSSRIFIAIAIAALATAACGRQAEDTARQDTAAAGAQRQQQEEATRLEQRVDELEREWNQVQERVSRGTANVTAEVKQEIQEAIAEVREEVNELRTINADNWWERTQAELEEEANEIEQDVRRFARRWTPGDSSSEVGTTGDDTSWRARRDRLVSRLEARIESMEEALKGSDARGADQEDVEETRERVSNLREETNRLRNAEEDNWWDVTRDRISEYIDRVEAAIRRL